MVEIYLALFKLSLATCMSRSSVLNLNQGDQGENLIPPSLPVILIPDIPQADIPEVPCQWVVPTEWGLTP